MNLGFFKLSLAQNINTDSIEAELTKNHPDTVKLQMLSDLNWYLGSSNIEKAKTFAERELELAKKIQNQKYIAQGLNDIGIILLKQNKFKEALVFHKDALKIRLTLPNKSDIASSYSKIGYCLTEMDEFKDALEAQLSALKIYHELQIKKHIAYTLNNICNLYINLKNFKKVNEYAQQSYQLALELNDRYSEATALNNLSSCHAKQKQMAEAIKKGQNALNIFLEIGDSASAGSMYNNLGHYYKEINNEQMALEYFKKAIEMALISNDLNSLGNFYSNIGNTYLALKNYAEAENNLKKAEKICTSQQMESTLIIIYKSFGDLYALTGKGNLAVNYYQKYANLKDSIFSLDMANQISLLQTKFETQEKEAQNLLLQKENELTLNKLNKSNIVKWSLVLGITLICFTFYFWYKNYKIKQQHILSNRLLQQQEENSRAIIEAEEKERTRIARDIHDGIGQQLSAAKLNIEALKNTLNLTTERQQDLFNNTVSLIDDAVTEARQVSHSMLANSLLKLGLIGAVRDFINKLNNLAGVKINIETFGLNERLNETTEMILFRVLQEIVNNIIKHAKASEVSIQFIKHDNELCLLIEDNGVGFDTTQITNFKGIGIKNIQSRINYLNGKVYFDSSVNNGTTVNIEIPI
jgi:signal transduction histidine kinase